MNLADAIRQAAKQAADQPKNSGPYVPPMFGEDEDKSMNPNQPNTGEKETFVEANEVQAAAPVEAGFEQGPEEESSFAFAMDAVTSEPVSMPETPNPTVRSGNVVRLELFLTPDQMTQLFRALVATQHAMFTLREAASYLRVNPSTIEQMAQEGQLPGLLIEGRWRFPKSSLDEWLNVQVFKNKEVSDAA